MPRSDDDYESRLQQYSAAQKELDESHEYSKWIYENLDKWLLGLSGAGLLSAAGATRALTDAAAPKNLLAISAGAFGLALVLAITSKAISYFHQISVPAKISVFYKSNEDFFDCMEAYKRKNRWVHVIINWITALCIMAFLAGTCTFSAFASIAAATPDATGVVHGTSAETGTPSPTEDP